MLSRRQVLVIGPLTVVFASSSLRTVCAERSGHQHDLGCALTNQGTLDIAARHKYGRSGNRDLDFALAHSLSRLTDMLGVNPGFLYFDDYGAGNAFATQATFTEYGLDGTVLFGEHLLAELLSGTDNPDASVACVCAHEFTHIYQFKNGLRDLLLEGQSTVKRTELQADFFAGFFSGSRKKENPHYAAAVYAVTAYNIGDYATNSRDHHGTPAERSAAIVRGFDAAYRERLSVTQAMSLSTEYVMSLP